VQEASETVRQPAPVVDAEAVTVLPATRPVRLEDQAVPVPETLVLPAEPVDVPLAEELVPENEENSVLVADTRVAEAVPVMANPASELETEVSQVPLQEPQTNNVIQLEPEQLIEETGSTAQQVQIEETPPELAAREEEVPLPEAATEVTDEVPASTSSFSELQGLIGVRARASGAWLQALSEKNGYTLQMASFPVTDQLLLEEYLQLLSLAALIDETYLCLIYATRTLPQNWLVIHGDFDGLSSARTYINQLPAYSRRYEPFVRNSRGVACLNNSNSESLLAF
jgi:hypothetical protein